jgi:hypothetical protein
MHNALHDNETFHDNYPRIYFRTYAIDELKLVSQQMNYSYDNRTIMKHEKPFRTHLSTDTYLFAITNVYEVKQGLSVFSSSPKM